MTVIHTCKVVYGSYDGIVKIRCNAEDDLEKIKGKIRRQESLTFLSMATYQVEIISTEHLDY